MTCSTDALMATPGRRGATAETPLCPAAPSPVDLGFARLWIVSYALALLALTAAASEGQESAP